MVCSSDTVSAVSICSENTAYCREEIQVKNETQVYYLFTDIYLHVITVGDHIGMQ